MSDLSQLAKQFIAIKDKIYKLETTADEYKKKYNGVKPQTYANDKTDYIIKAQQINEDIRRFNDEADNAASRKVGTPWAKMTIDERNEIISWLDRNVGRTYEYISATPPF